MERIVRKSLEKRIIQKSATDILEEAFQLLRLAPAAAWFSYFAGTFPFIAALLWFWADMSKNPLAGNHAVESALAIAALFVWMKTWHGIFSWRMRNTISGKEPQKLSRAQLKSLIRTAIVAHPYGFIVLPLSAVAAIPFAWSVAFYQNLNVMAIEEPPDKVVSAAWTQAKLWPLQNNAIVSILFIIALLVFFNVGIGVIAIPALLRMLLGIETVLTRGGTSIFNTTFFAIVGSLTYVLLDPLVKSIYLLRCFYGKSQQTGEDLLADLDSIASARKRKSFTAIASLFLLALLMTSAVSATPGSPPQKTAESSPSASRHNKQLDQSIEKTLQKKEYRWRYPRDAAKNEPGAFLKFFLKIHEKTRWLREKIAKLWWRFSEWLRKMNPMKDRSSGGTEGIETTTMVLYGMLALAAITGLYLLWRFRKNKRAVQKAKPVPAAFVPDLTEENVSAGDLPEDGWRRLAAELLEKGEFKLALRALYLATLAHLGRNEMIHIARFKSNRDYFGELRRRAHDQPRMIEAFAENLVLFERSWYGRHDVTHEVLQQFRENSERITIHEQQ